MSIRKNVLLKYIKICTTAPRWCHFEGYKYGRRRATETFLFEFSFKHVNSLLEELMKVKVIFILRQGMFR